ncbi:MAG: xanthine phosphoribosyltransferase [Clostridia bacterium]|nr:xanthine phosphoribosyltransferase [Clostridia bacterium]
MKLLEDKILREGKVLAGDILKVDGFLNHRLDTALITALGKDIAKQFANSGASLILTVESSGIAIAFAAGQAMGLPVLVAKKSKTLNISDGVYTAPVFSYTHKTENTVLVSNEYLSAADKVLIVDDFLASGNAAMGLLSLVEQAGAKAVGFVAAIEKAHQGGRALIEAKGVPVYSLACIKEMRAGEIIFD